MSASPYIRKLRRQRRQRALAGPVAVLVAALMIGAAQVLWGVP